MHDAKLQRVIRSVRPALNGAELNERDRAQFLYELVREVYDHVKHDVHGSATDASERNRIGAVLDKALPPIEPPRDETQLEDTPRFHDIAWPPNRRGDVFDQDARLRDALAAEDRVNDPREA